MISELFTRIEVSTWRRKEHYEKWIGFDEPFHGIVIKIDLTHCHSLCVEKNYKIFDRYMYHLVNALNDIEPMRYRLYDGQPVIFDEVVCGLVVMKPDDTFAYGHLSRTTNFEEFAKQMKQEKKRINDRGTLHDTKKLLNITHFSVLPWTDFLSLSHARKYGDGDSIPKITFGKITKNKTNYSMPMSIHVHHALVDGKDVADFIESFQEMLLERS